MRNSKLEKTKRRNKHNENTQKHNTHENINTIKAFLNFWRIIQKLLINVNGEKCKDRSKMTKLCLQAPNSKYVMSCNAEKDNQ